MATMTGMVISTVRQRLMKVMLTKEPRATTPSRAAGKSSFRPNENRNRPRQTYGAKRENMTLLDVIFDDNVGLHVPFQRKRRDEAQRSMTPSRGELMKL